tara:strand:+ start:130 stop:447 length:318 start_codon:yes stop_codon:yes gene_type:complete
MSQICRCSDGIKKVCNHCNGEGKCSQNWNTGCEGCCSGGVGGISKTRGTQQSSSKYGARGQRQEFSNFSGLSTLKIMWWGLGALVVLTVVGKGVKIYKEIVSKNG